MTKYKISISIDEQNSFWIVVNNGNIINNPTKEDLIGAKPKYYNKTNICPRCRKENNITIKSILYPGNSRRDTDKEGKKIEEWVCSRHGLNHYNKYDSNGQNNMRKSLADRRTGNLNDPDNVFGYKCEELTCRWRGIKNLNKEYDNYHSPIDHSIDPELGKIQTKGAKLITLRYDKLKYDIWSITLRNDYTKEFDHIILYCVSKDGRLIERIYIIPKKEILIRTGMAIYKNAIGGWYKKYRIIDENIIKLVNDIWQDIIKGMC